MILIPREELDRFHSPAVRDLVWCITCAPIVTLCQPPGPLRIAADAQGDDASPPRVVSDPGHWLQVEDILYAWERMQDHLQQLDRDDRALRAWMEPVSAARLGLRFERNLHWWFLHDPAITVLGRDIPIVAVIDESGRRRTLGQIDFILDWAGEIVHLEVAVKFYLRLGGRDQLGRYVGVNPGDRMDIKLAHMLHRQRTLTATAEARSELQRRNVPVPDSQRVSLRGILYQPLSSISISTGAGTNSCWWGSPIAISEKIAAGGPRSGQTRADLSLFVVPQFVRT